MSKNITTKSANFKNENSLAQGKAPVLNLTIDGSYPEAEVREIAPAPDDAFQTPCSISGVMAGLSGGTLGYAFGFGKTPTPPTHALNCSIMPLFYRNI